MSKIPVGTANLRAYFGRVTYPTVSDSQGTGYGTRLWTLD